MITMRNTCISHIARITIYVKLFRRSFCEADDADSFVSDDIQPVYLSLESSDETHFQETNSEKTCFGQSRAHVLRRRRMRVAAVTMATIIFVTVWFTLILAETIFDKKLVFFLDCSVFPL